MNIKRFINLIFLPYRYFFSKPTRQLMKRYYSSKKILKHDINSDLRTSFLKPLSDNLVGEIPENFRIHNNQLDFFSKGSVMSLQSYYTGEVEFHLTKYLIDNTLKNNMVFLDIGGHHGAFSVIVAKELKDKNFNGKIFTFEPSAENREFIEKNLEVNNLSKFTTIIPKGVSSYTGRQNFYVSTDNSCNTLLEEEGDSSTSIDVISIDDFCKDFNRVDLIKMDIQGGEYNALIGAKETLLKHKPLILIEIMDYIETSKASKEFLRSLGYTLKYLNKNSQLVEENDPSIFVSWDVIALPN